MSQSKLDKQIRKLTEDYEQAMQSLASEVRRDHVIPFCRDHNYLFFAGMGTWVFRDRKNQAAISDSKIPKRLYNLLSTSCGRWGVSIGAIMEDVRAEDLDASQLSIADLGARVEDIEVFPPSRVLLQQAYRIASTGEIIISAHRHDAKTFHIGDEEFFIDGGTEYERASLNLIDALNDGRLIDMRVYDDTPIETAVEKLLWGTYGKRDENGNVQEPFRHVLMKDCESDHLRRILEYKLSDYRRRVIEHILSGRTD